MFFLASGRDMARITGLRGFCKNLKMLRQMGGSSCCTGRAKMSRAAAAVALLGVSALAGVLGVAVPLGELAVGEPPAMSAKKRKVRGRKEARRQ
jgi:hypothetical protein